MKKHYHAIRSAGKPELAPLQTLIVFESDNSFLTIEDFSRFGKSEKYELIQSFYIGFMSCDEAVDRLTKLNVRFALFE